MTVWMAKIKQGYIKVIKFTFHFMSGGAFFKLPFASENNSILHEFYDYKQAQTISLIGLVFGNCTPFANN